MFAGFGVNPCMEIMHDSRENLLGLLVKVGDGDSSSKNSIIRVLGGKVSGSLSCEIVELNSGNTSMDTLNDLLGDLGGFDEVRIKTV